MIEIMDGQKSKSPSSLDKSQPYLPVKLMVKSQSKSYDPFIMWTNKPVTSSSQYPQYQGCLHLYLLLPVKDNSSYL